MAWTLKKTFLWREIELCTFSQNFWCAHFCAPFGQNMCAFVRFFEKFWCAHFCAPFGQSMCAFEFRIIGHSGNFIADEWRMTILAILHEIKTECRMILIFVLKAKTKEKQAQKWILTNVFFRLKIIDQNEWRISHSNLSWWNIHITIEDFVQFEGWTRGLPKGELWTFIFDSFDGKKYLVSLKTQVQTTYRN